VTAGNPDIRRANHRGDYVDDERWTPQSATITVLEAEGPEWTGLYDVRGAKLFRPRTPMGIRAR
jgi:hypothetical protein